MMIPLALHPTDDIRKEYVSRKKGEREFASFKDNVNASIHQLEDCMKNVQSETNYKEPRHATQASTE